MADKPSSPERSGRAESLPQSYRGRATVWVIETDTAIRGWMLGYGTRLLRYSLGLVFIWFGALKPLGMSPAAELIGETVYLVPPEVFVPLLGWWEVLVGLCLLYRPLIRVGILLLALMMPGTFLPLVVVPEATWIAFPYAPSMEGQYIFKNLVLISAALVVGGTVSEEEAITAPFERLADLLGRLV